MYDAKTGILLAEGNAVECRRKLKCSSLDAFYALVMKNLINSIKNKFNKAAISAKAAIESTTGEGYIDTGVKIIIGVVIGGVILAGLYTLFNTTIMPTLTTKISEMFSYTGK